MPVVEVDYAKIKSLGTNFTDSRFFWVGVEPTNPELIKIVGIITSVPNLTVYMPPASVKATFLADIIAAKRFEVNDFSP